MVRGGTTTATVRSGVSIAAVSSSTGGVSDPGIALPTELNSPVRIQPAVVASTITAASLWSLILGMRGSRANVPPLARQMSGRWAHVVFEAAGFNRRWVSTFSRRRLCTAIVPVKKDTFDDRFDQWR
jgi:hypothetical protein